MYTLYQFKTSPFCDKVRRILHYKGLEFRIREISVTASLFGAVRRMSKVGKLPVLQAEDEHISDSTAIAIYLESRHPDTKPLLPSDLAERARALLLENWADEVLYFYEMYYRFCNPQALAQTVPKLLHADPALLRPLLKRMIPGTIASHLQQQGLTRRSHEEIAQSMDEICADLDRLCAGGYLVGEGVTLADIGVFAQMSCIAETDEGKAQIQHRPALCDWMERIRTGTAAG